MKEEPKKHAKKCPMNEYVPQPYEKEPDCVCDEYHTFDELYEHRIRLFIALAKMSDRNASLHQRDRNVWCSTKHSDGSEWRDWFILGIGKKAGQQITYHLPARFWNEVCEFAEVLKTAPEYDGHTSDDVIRRLESHPEL